MDDGKHALIVAQGTLYLLSTVLDLLQEKGTISVSDVEKATAGYSPADGMKYGQETRQWVQQMGEALAK